MVILYNHQVRVYVTFLVTHRKAAHAGLKKKRLLESTCPAHVVERMKVIFV